MKALLLLFTLFIFASADLARAQNIHACDWEAAHPSDPDRAGPAKGSGEVDTARAIAACRQAVDDHPEVARFHYQLGRALVYDADRNDGNWYDGLPPLEEAAKLEHRQAIFVLGLMRKREDEMCASEPLTRRAAEMGLKSARISYVNDYLSGALDDCPPQASLDQMAGYLEAARSQVDGWYENMLLDVLGRNLAGVQEQVAAAEAEAAE